LPEGIDASSPGFSSSDRIAGGDVRVFAVRVKEAGVTEIPSVAIPPQPRGLAVPLRQGASIEEQILAQPSFFEHFDGVVVQGRYLLERESSALRDEAAWLRSQGVRLFVDLSAQVDLYPGLRLIDNLPADYQASMKAIADVLDKMCLFGAHDLILSLHRYPENNFTGAQTQAAFETTLRALARQAASNLITIHLRMAFGKPPSTLADLNALLDKVGSSNLRMAASTALLARTTDSPQARQILKDKLGLWLVAASRTDAAGVLWDAHAPLHQAPDLGPIAAWLAAAPERPMLLDSVTSNSDEAYLEALQLAGLQARSKTNR
jgi:hypothetical protein